MKTLLFSQEEISQIVHSVGLDGLMDEVIDGLTAACEQFDPSDYSVPVRSGFSYEDGDHKGLLEWMPALRYGDRVVVKLVGYHPDNPAKLGVPTVLSTVITFDTRTGHATSVIDGTFLTSVRTGAASAVASKVLAQPESKVLGLLGTGAQAVTQMHALSRSFQFEKGLVHDTDMAACNSFENRMRFAALDVPIEVRSVEEVLVESDIVCTATSIDVGAGPLFGDAMIKEHLHINAVGSDFPGKVELPTSLLKRSLVCPDFLSQAVAEGECQQLAPEEIGPELTELVSQRNLYAQYRSSPTVFDSTGWALEDLVAAEIITRIGANAGLGLPVDLQCMGNDPKNPYSFLAPSQGEEGRFSIEKELRALDEVAS
jgi:ornithine cyclodeaminase/alanine dehydrogenase-like protein (mu-crystallin family)